MAGKKRVGIIGCGNILRAYVQGCRAFDILAAVEEFKRWEK